MALTTRDLPGDPIKCKNRREGGRSCRHTIALQLGPMIIGLGADNAHVDPASTLCFKCGQWTHWRTGADDAPLPFRPTVDRDRQPVALTA